MKSKPIKIVLGFLIIITAFNIWLIYFSGNIIPLKGSRGPVFYTKDELITLYWEHKDELTEMAEIVLESQSLRDRINDNNEDDWAIRYKSDKRDFSEEEWEKIVDVFKKTRPLMIMRSLRRSQNVLYFTFPKKEIEGHTIGTSLFYFRNPKAAEIYSEYTWVGVLEHLDGYWYVEEKCSDRKCPIH